MRGGLMESTLAFDALSTEVIADGRHLADELLLLAYKISLSIQICKSSLHECIGAGSLVSTSVVPRIGFRAKLRSHFSH
jgi:hypothetical protein